MKSKFNKVNAVVIGISPDSVKSHQNFIIKKQLGIDLLSDPDHKVIEACGAWQKKKLYGREYFGVVRSTVLIDPEGKVAFYWTKVKARGHAQAVKDKLQELS